MNCNFKIIFNTQKNKPIVLRTMIMNTFNLKSKQ